MKLHLLIPSLKYACSVTLASHKDGKLGERAALVIAFDKNRDPQILFFPDTNDPKLPLDYVYGIALLDAGLAGLCATLVGFDLTHEVTVERMAFNVLANLHCIIYGLKPSHDLTLELAAKLDLHSVSGITSAIAHEQFAEQKAPLVPVLNQRN